MPAGAARARDYSRWEDRAPKKKKAKVLRLAPRPHLDTRLRKRAAIFFMVAAITATITVVRSEISAMRAYELSKAQQQAARIESENKQLELQIAEMRAPQRIKSIAINDLGMTIPKEVYFSAERQ